MNHTTAIKEPTSAYKAKFRKQIKDLDYNDIKALFDDAKERTWEYHILRAKIKELKDKAWLMYFHAKNTLVNRYWISSHRQSRMEEAKSDKAKLQQFLHITFTIQEASSTK